MTEAETDDFMRALLTQLSAALPEKTAVVLILAKQEAEGVQMSGYSNVDPKGARAACAYGPALFDDDSTVRYDQ